MTINARPVRMRSRAALAAAAVAVLAATLLTAAPAAEAVEVKRLLYASSANCERQEAIYRKSGVLVQACHEWYPYGNRMYSLTFLFTNSGGGM